MFSLNPMRRVQGNPDVALLECTNPIRNKWRVRWNVVIDESGSASYMEQEYRHRPSTDEIRTLVCDWINQQTDEKILSGFSFEGNLVWLSTENQFNYKAAYDLAVQSAGATLPVTFKLGTDDKPCYRTFNTVDELSDFYVKAMAHVQTSLAEGWAAKDAFDPTLYSAQ